MCQYFSMRASTLQIWIKLYFCTTGFIHFVTGCKTELYICECLLQPVYPQVISEVQTWSGAGTVECPALMGLLDTLNQIVPVMCFLCPGSLPEPNTFLSTSCFVIMVCRQVIHNAEKNNTQIFLSFEGLSVLFVHSYNFFKHNRWI